MSFASGRRLALVSMLLLAACSVSAQRVDDPPATAPPTNQTVVVRFDVEGVLTATPKQEIEIKVSVAGSNAPVQVWLEGDYSDASLDRGEVAVPTGSGSFRLRAPSMPATFALRGRVAGASDARLEVAVSANGFGTIRVLPTYAGQRPVPGITASVFMQTTCAELATTELKDGALRGEGSHDGGILLKSVPAGARVSVLARIRFYAVGCVDLDSIAAQATRDLEVTVIDRPMALDKTDLATTFSFEPDPSEAAAWNAMLDLAITKTADAFMPQSAPEALRLLDSMRAASLSPSAFDAARAQGSWNDRATQWLSQRAPTLRARAATWMTAAKPDLLGVLSARLKPGAKPGQATLTLDRFGKLSATDAGMVVRTPFNLVADADDVVHLTGVVHVYPSALVARGGDLKSGSTVADALGTAIDCGGLAQSLGGYAGCDATCTATLCRSALDTLWQSAADVSLSSNDAAPIGMTASAQASVGDYAEPTNFNGAWIGQVGANATYGAAFGMRGSARASKP